MARILSLLPGNRTEPVSLDPILRKFLTPPALDNVHHELRLATALEARAFSKGGSQALPPLQGLKIETDQHQLLRSGSFVPFTIIGGRSTDEGYANESIEIS